MMVYKYLETMYSVFIMSSNVLVSEDMLSTFMNLNPMVSVDSMVVSQYLETKYLIMLIQDRKTRP